MCLAGHPPALIRRADGRVQEVGVTGPLLGYAQEVRLTDARFRLAPGDRLLLYTAGAIAARPAPGRPAPRQPMFDDKALTGTLADSHGLGAAAATSRIADALAARHDGWASDDTALLALYLPPA